MSMKRGTRRKERHPGEAEKEEALCRGARRAELCRKSQPYGDLRKTRVPGRDEKVQRPRAGSEVCVFLEQR